MEQDKSPRDINLYLEAVNGVDKAYIKFTSVYLMPTLEQARLLGGIGSILAILSILPTAGAVLGIIGFILVLIAVKYISEITGDESIFKNYLIAVIIAIVGLVIVTFAGVASFMTAAPFMAGGPGPGLSGGLFGFLSLSMIGILVALWVLTIISAYFIRKSFNTIATALNVKMFGTAALLYFIGAILLIVLVGGIVIFIAEILQIVAFFQIPVEKPAA